MTHRPGRKPEIEDHSGTNAFGQTTPNRNIDMPTISAQVRSRMASMGIESPDLQSSQNSTMTYRELGTITTDIDNLTISPSPAASDSMIRSPIVNPRETVSPATKNDHKQLQCGRHDGFNQEGNARLTRDLVSSAMKSYMKKRIEKKAEILIDETQALVKAKIEEWLKQNGETSQAEENEKDLDTIADENNDDNDGGGHTSCNMNESYHEDAVVSINTTPSDVAVVVSPGSDGYAMLNDNITQIPSPSPIRAFQKHTRTIEESPSISRIENNHDKDNNHCVAASSKGHIHSTSTECSESKDLYRQLQTNHRQVEQFSQESSNQKHEHMNSILSKLRTSPLFSPVRQIKTMRELEKELDEQVSAQTGSRISNTIGFECRQRQNATKCKVDAGNNAIRANRAVVTLIRDDDKLETVEPTEAAAMKTNCGDGLGGGLARAVNVLRKKGQWKHCFFSKEDGD